MPPPVAQAPITLVAVREGAVLSGDVLRRRAHICEFRSGGDPAILLLPGAKRYGVCVVASGPVAALDAELPVADTPDRFTVQVEDGRQFGRCLLTSLKAEGSGNKRRLTYCLRCEDVTVP